MARTVRPPGGVTPLTTQAYLTQIAIEQWGSSASGPISAQLTQIAIEQWASVAQAAAASAQAMAIIIA